MIIDRMCFIHKVGVRKVCQLMRFNRSSYYYQKAEDPQAIMLIQKIKDIAAVRVRYGYRRIHVLLRREGIKVNAKRVYRLYCKTNLQLRNKRPKKRVKAKAR